jgi:hypothetical protein
VGSIPHFQDVCWQPAVSGVFQLGFVAPPCLTQALKWSRPAVSESRGERFGLARIFRLMRAYLGRIGPKVRALDMTSTKGVNTTLLPKGGRRSSWKMFPIRLHTMRSPTDYRIGYEGEHRVLAAMGGIRWSLHI